MPEAITQLGLAASVLFIVYLILRILVGSISSNDKQNGDTTKSLITLLTNTTSAINNNSTVISKLEAYISSDRSATKETLNVLKTEILDRFGTTDRKIDLVIKMIGEVQRSLDETIPVRDKSEQPEELF